MYINISEVSLWFFCFVVMMALAIAGGNTNLRKDYLRIGIVICIFFVYLALGTIGLYHTVKFLLGG